MTTQGRVTVIGTGAIGTAIAHRLLSAGSETVVWNRTPSRVLPLVNAGAHRAASPAEAIDSSPLTLLTLTDYTAVADVLAGVGSDDGPENGGGPPTRTRRTVIALCTGSPAGARTAADLAAARGLTFLAAGIQAAPDSIGTEAATILYGGDRAAFDLHLPTLELLGHSRFAGHAPEAAAIWDLTLFGLWYDAQLGLLRALDTVRAAGIDLTAFADAAATPLGHVVTAVPSVLAELTTGSFPPGPAALPEHLTVLNHLTALRAAGPLGDGGLTAAITRIQALQAANRSTEGLTALIDPTTPGHYIPAGGGA